MGSSASTTRTSGVVVGEPRARFEHPLSIAILTYDIARLLGVSSRYSPSSLAYGDDDSLVFDAPLTSLVCGVRTRFLRGWKQYQSCIKGFNGLGLIAEHCLSELAALRLLSPAALRAERIAFLSSRVVGSAAVFTSPETISEEELEKVDPLWIALWRAFSRRTIVCSTSSNMGVSLHEALRFVQQTILEIGGIRFTLFNKDEGSLIIWCPAEEADFMNPEKTALLRGIEAEQPPLTRLHTYINRKQRDPAALQDALVMGGFFFPTNPQSVEEMQHLLTLSLTDLAHQRQVPFDSVLRDPMVRQGLNSLGVEIHDEGVIVRNGVEGGLYGLMTPYLLLLEETLARGDTEAITVWNQASIGAALAAAVLCDQELFSHEALPEGIRDQLEKRFPLLGRALNSARLRSLLTTRIHGVFDIANLQSLAQLFGVVIRHHLSGRGTAYVGLGSSSYSNGNRCYDILRDNARMSGAFRGGSALHVATHTLNPVAQALIFGEDLHRTLLSPEYLQLPEAALIERVSQHARKPEPAGAASLAGYLLRRLDDGTLSVAEIAFALKISGFSKDAFLRFCQIGEDPGSISSSAYSQLATEEGPRMATFAEELQRLLDAPLESVRIEASRSRLRSRLGYAWTPFDDDSFESRAPVLHIYLTGDNCAQPDAELVCGIIKNALATKELRGEVIASDRQELRNVAFLKPIRVARTVQGVLGSVVRVLEKAVEKSFQHLVRPSVNAMARRRMNPALWVSEELPPPVRVPMTIRENSQSAGQHGISAPKPASYCAQSIGSCRTAHEILERFHSSSSQVFLIHAATGSELTYGEFFLLAKCAAGVLTEYGVKRGDRIVLALPNSREFVALYFGAMFLGVGVVPLSPNASRSEVDFILSNSRAQLVLVAESTAHVVRDSRVRDLPRSVHVSLLGEEASGVVLSEGIPVEPFVGARDDDILSMLFTSGTTGSPKAVVNKIEASFLNARYFNEKMGFDHRCRMLHNWPMSYSTGLLNCLVNPFMCGGVVVLHRPFDSTSILDFWKVIVEHSINALWLSPTMVSGLVKLDRDPRGVEYCRNEALTVCVGTAPLPPPVQERFEKKYSTRLYESYGLSELLILTSRSPSHDRQRFGVGSCLHGVSLRAVSESGKVLPQGTEGELEARTPYCMMGYLDYKTGNPDRINPEAWFATGDIGVISDEGAVRITGRKKDLIIRAGLNISPRAIEDLLYSHPSVQRVAVVGIPDELYGENIAVCVEAKGGVDFTVLRTELLELARRELSQASVPQHILEFSDFPLNRSGKIVKSMLRERVIERLAQRDACKIEILVPSGIP